MTNLRTGNRRSLYILLAVLMLLCMVLVSGCSKNAEVQEDAAAGSEAVSEDAAGSEKDSAGAENDAAGSEGDAANSTKGSAASESDAASDKSDAVSSKSKEPRDVVILFTSDIHCGVGKGWTLAGLQQIRDTLEADGVSVLLADNGDAIQGEPIGTFTQGKKISELMNLTGYDVAIPGNHEFEYGVDNFIDLVRNSKFPYISCNFNKGGELVLDPYVILDAGGKKIAFVGVTTPTTITSSTPVYFQDEDGNFIYDFMQGDSTGQELYNSIQESVDAARTDGAEYVILLGHLGNQAANAVWCYDQVAANTTGIDAILDGHSHDRDQVSVANRDGVKIPRSACGTKMESIGWARISAADGKITTGLYEWKNNVSALDLLGFDNELNGAIREAMGEIEEQMSGVIGKTEYELTIYDPEAKTEDGKPVRIVRNTETNLGDLAADALRDQTGAEIAIIGSGEIRENISVGEISKGDVYNALPFNEDVCVAEVTGQQILDALEFSVSKLPNEFGGFMQVSGLTFEIDMSIPSSCTKDKNGLFTGVEGERRVRNVMVGNDPIEPDGRYELASTIYVLREQGDGYTMFSADDPIRYVTIDNEAVMKYIENTLGGTVGKEYADPYGQGRIVAAE